MPVQFEAAPGGCAIVPAINRPIGWTRSHRLPVIFTREMHRADPSDYGIDTSNEDALTRIRTRQQPAA